MIVTAWWRVSATCFGVVFLAAKAAYADGWIEFP